MLAQHTWRKRLLSDFGALSKPKLHSRRPRILCEVNKRGWTTKKNMSNRSRMAVNICFFFSTRCCCLQPLEIKNVSFFVRFERYTNVHSASRKKKSARSFSHGHSFFIEFQNMAFIWDNMMIPINIGQNGFFAPCIIAMSIYYTNTQPGAMCAFYEPFLWWTRYSSKNSFDPNQSNTAKWPFSISLCASLQKNNGNNANEKQPTEKKSV